MLVKMIDGGLVNYDDESYSYSGCPTCDWGSEYIQNINMGLTKHEINITLNKMYGYALSQGDVIKLFCGNYEKISNMTELEFCNFLRDWMVEKCGKNIIEEFEVKNFSTR